MQFSNDWSGALSKTADALINWARAIHWRLQAMRVLMFSITSLKVSQTRVNGVRFCRSQIFCISPKWGILPAGRAIELFSEQRYQTFGRLPHALSSLERAAG